MAPAGGGAGRAAPPAGAGAAGGGLPTPATPADRRALAGAARHGGEPVDVGGTPVVPGAAGFDANAARNHVPVTLIVVLALLAAAAAAATTPFVRRHAGALR